MNEESRKKLRDAVEAGVAPILDMLEKLDDENAALQAAADMRDIMHKELADEAYVVTVSEPELHVLEHIRTGKYAYIPVLRENASKAAVLLRPMIGTQCDCEACTDAAKKASN